MLCNVVDDVTNTEV